MDLQNILNMILKIPACKLTGKKVMLVVIGEEEVDFATNMSVDLVRDAALALAESCAPGLTKEMFAAC